MECPLRMMSSRSLSKGVFPRGTGLELPSMRKISAASGCDFMVIFPAITSGENKIIKRYRSLDMGTLQY
jgi:hypothetical protein